MATGQLEFYHSELTDWNKSLEFYEDEIRSYNNRLRDVVTRNTKMNVLNGTEHFQKQFTLQNEQFELLKHDIQEQERKLGINMPDDDKLINQPVLEDQHLLRDKLQEAEKTFIETKHGFYRFLSAVL